MISALVRPLGFACRAGLAGPIFDKELRVASRRRRHYVLRFAYVVLLMFFIASIWVDAVRFRGPLSLRQTQMEVAARTLTRGIVWFQFIAAQIVAVMAMSTAISDEVYGRTLGVLMTTPLSSVQLVLGKLFSRLFQILLLVATTLPLLAVVRVLGGIPWSFLLWSLLITWTSVIFAGSVSLFFSTLCRRTYVVIIAAAISIGSLFLLVPFVATVIPGGGRHGNELLESFRFVNPYLLLSYCTDYMLSPFRRARVPIVALVVCTSFLLLGSILLLHASVRLVRQVALRRAAGDKTFLDYLRRDRAAGLGPGKDRDIRRVVGPPMVWKELTCALSRREKLAAKLAIGMELLLLLIAYTFPALSQAVSYEGTHLLYLALFLGLGALFTLSVSATVISSERESHAWPLLLLTPLRDRDLLVGKFAGVVRRCGLVWLPVLAYLLAFTLADCFRPPVLVQMAALILSVVIFLTATGFYFGSRCRRTTEAVGASLILAGVVWFVAPLVVQWICGVWRLGPRARGDWAFLGVPFAQLSPILDTTLVGDDGFWRWSYRQKFDAGDITAGMLASLAAYAVIASGFVWRATRAFRRRIL